MYLLTLASVHNHTRILTHTDTSTCSHTGTQERSLSPPGLYALPEAWVHGPAVQQLSQKTVFPFTGSFPLSEKYSMGRIPKEVT